MKSLFALFLQATQVLAVSQIAIFSDEHCQNSLRGLEGPNGYPNGTCTDLRRNGPYGSFQVVGLDPGCTVTIYAKDTTEDICSGYAEEIRPVECHNNTFVYYSIDFCDVNPVNEQPPSSRSSSTSTPEAASSALSPGAIAGAVVGGVAGLAIIVGLIVFFVLKKRKQAQNNSPEVAEYVATAPAEVHGKHLHEMGAVAYKQTAVEVEHPPAELEGTEMRADEQSRPFN